MQTKEFPNYTQMEPKLSRWFWHVLRILTLLLAVWVIYLLFYQPELGLIVFWKFIIPPLPLVFAVIPGLWRNICPMAFLNQLPRLTGTGMQLTLLGNARKLALLLSILAFILFVTSRAPLLNHSAKAVGVMLICVLLLAFIGGLVFKGRSGWCGTFCPLAPLQKVYGHAPLLMVRNGYCEPCVGCQKNCYDFNPRAAIFSDLDRNDIWWSDKRKFFAAALPGLIVGFFNAVSPDDAGTLNYYISILTPPLISIGLYYTVQNTLQLNNYRTVALFGMTALGIFYWYGIPVVASGVEQVFDVTLPPAIVFMLRSAAILICIAVIVRGQTSERAYRLAEQTSAMASVGSGVSALKAAIKESESNLQVKEQASGKQFEIKPEQSLLDAIEAAELPIMSGCRMGMCGSDPVVITEGKEGIAPPDENELTTLRRLGLEGKARLACCCRPANNIAIDLNADPGKIERDDSSETEVNGNNDESNCLKVITIGNGIAGISTVESIRENNKDCKITLISQEPHHFYNRMGLEKVVHGHTAMQGLYLMQEEWYQRNEIDVWLNTRVVSINKETRQVELGSGEQLAYDKLVLATGGRAFRPAMPGADLPGCFTLRDANDAMSIRAWVQNHQCKKAVVLGGGVLGVEAADALRQLGLKVAIVHTSGLLMNRQLDLNAGTILEKFLTNSGVDVITDTGIQHVDGDDRLRRVTLSDGTVIAADLLLFCIGIRANTSLAERAGLDINRGVLVDHRMHTSDADIYCVGDAAELPDAMSGLWSIGHEQGKVAAASILDLDKRYENETMPPVQLKVSGIDLKCFGNMSEEQGVDSYSGGDVEQHQWKHLLVTNGKVTGGVFVNTPLAANAAIAATKLVEKKLSEREIEEILSRDHG